MNNLISELERLGKWVRDMKYNREDAPDEIARAIENRVRQLKAEGLKPEIFSPELLCELCYGVGTIEGRRCPICHGEPITYKSVENLTNYLRTINLNVPQEYRQPMLDNSMFHLRDALVLHKEDTARLIWFLNLEGMTFSQFCAAFAPSIETDKETTTIEEWRAAIDGARKTK